MRNEQVSRSCNQRIDDCRHHRWADAVAEHANTVTASADGQFEILVEAHGPLELGNLQHPHSRLTLVVPDQSEAIQGRDRAKGAVERLPATTAIAAVIDQKEAGVPSEHLEAAPRSFKGSLRSPPEEQRRCFPGTRGIKHGLHRPGPAGLFAYWLFRLPLSVPREEQAPAALRNSEAGRIQNMFSEMVTQTLELFLQFAISRPRPHMSHVLQDQPPGTQRAGIFDDLHGGRAAGFVALRVAPGTAVTRALRRCEQEVNCARFPPEGVEADGFQTFRPDAGVREIGGEGSGRYRAHVDAGSDLHSRRLRSGAAAAGAAEHVKCPDHRSSPACSRRSSEVGRHRGT